MQKHVICNSCNMGTRDLPDMYAQGPRATDLWAEGIHIRQITRAHVTSNICIMVRGRIKGYHQCYKSFVTRLTTGCDTVMYSNYNCCLAIN